MSDALARRPAAPPSPLYLRVGAPVLAEPAASRLGAALAERAGGSFALRRRPADLLPLLEDLRTFALFGGGKVLAVVDTAVLADRAAAAELVAEALASPTPSGDSLAPREREGASRLLQALHLFGVEPLAGDPAAVLAARAAAAELVAEALASPTPSGDSLAPREREGASRLLQALHLFGVEPLAGDPAAVLAAVPDWGLAGKKGGRISKKEAESRREALRALLEAARRDGLTGLGEEAVGQLADLLRRGLPAGHALILAERSVASDHPLVGQLRERGALLQLGEVAAGRDGWTGADGLARELERELGVSIGRDALAELSRRTLRQEEGRGGGADSDSTARFAAEYRKLADLAGAGAIERRLVEETVEDRGEEDVWQVLDALADGRSAEALSRLERLVAGSEDPGRARLAFFSLLAGFCRQLLAVRGVVDRLGAPRGQRSYTRFKDRIAPALTGELPEGLPNPPAGGPPFRLPRPYLPPC